MNVSLGLTIEILVAILLVMTIGYCFVLNRRLKRLHADEASLKATISELITATEIAERAIMGLKMAANECDESLGKRLSEAEWFSREIADQLGAGETVLKRISQIALVADTKSAAQPSLAAPRSAEDMLAPVDMGTIRGAEDEPERGSASSNGMQIRRAAAETAERLKALRRQSRERVA